MKTNLRVLTASLAALAAITAAAAACGPPPRRSDWRTPAPGAPARPCTTDADCNGGVCSADPAVSAGQQSQGTCSQAPLLNLPSGAGGDGGGAPMHPTHPGSPLVQPSPSDIHL